MHSNKLSEIASIYDGTHQTPKYQETGIPFISVENIANIYDTDKYISLEEYNLYKVKPQLNDLFMTRIGTVGKCAIVNKLMDLAYYVSLALIRPDSNIIDTRYLKYYIESSLGKKELSKRVLHHAVPVKINKEDIGKIMISYPELSIQKIIADLLDNFDSICTDLDIGIPAEIEARKKQYEFYRDQLLTFVQTGHSILTDRQTDRQKARKNLIKLFQYVFGYASIKIKYVYTRLKGTSITASKMKEISCNNGDVRIYAGGKTVATAFESKIPNANIIRLPSVIIQSRGIIDAIYCCEPFTFKNEMWAYTNDNEVTVKYLYYVIKNNLEFFRDAASGMGSLPQISHSVTEDFIINLPSIDEQQKIVSILDKFDKITNDIIDGIPAEIEARKKQYEYYRDKLLTFKMKQE